MDVDGPTSRASRASPGRDGHASWTPDGKEILFTGKRDGNQDVWIVDADGGNRRRLTDSPAADGGGRGLARRPEDRLLTPSATATPRSTSWTATART